MAFRVRPSLLAALVAAACLAVAFGLWRWTAAHEENVLRWLERLPDEDRLLVYIDVAALRASGLLEVLAGSPAEEEADYRAFVRETGFDYREDLDALLAVWEPGETAFFARGRFDWDRIYRYTERRAGECLNAYCRLHGSTSGRWISFFPLTTQVLVLVSAPNAYAGYDYQWPKRELNPDRVPAEPLWVMMPGWMLRERDWLPAGTKAFARPLTEADRLVLALDAVPAGFEARLRVDCASPRQAEALAGRLRTATELLQSLLAKERKQPNPRDLSGVLTKGEFWTVGDQVQGRWPVPMGLIESLGSGG